MLLALVLGCPKNTEVIETPGPTVGWTIKSGWTGACFTAPDFSTLDGEVRGKQERDSLTAMTSQWLGARNDGVRFDEKAARGVGKLLPAERIGEIAAQNLAFCAEVMSGEASTAAWSAWLEELYEDLQEEACPDPLVDTYLTLDVTQQWFAEVPVCAGDHWFLRAESDQYRTTKGASTHTVMGTEGDASGLPCPDCPRGSLIVRFDGEDGSSTLMIGGTYAEGTAPVSGTLSIGLNDDDFSDNTYRVKGGVQDSVGVQVGPKR